MIQAIKRWFANAEKREAERLRKKGLNVFMENGRIIAMAPPNSKFRGALFEDCSLPEDMFPGYARINGQRGAPS